MINASKIKPFCSTQSNEISLYRFHFTDKNISVIFYSDLVLTFGDCLPLHPLKYSDHLRQLK